MSTEYIATAGLLTALALMLLSAPVARAAECPDPTDETVQAADRSSSTEQSIGQRDEQTHGSS